MKFDVNNYQYNPNNGVQQQPEQTYQADKNIQGYCKKQYRKDWDKYTISYKLTQKQTTLNQ